MSSVDLPEIIDCHLHLWDIERFNYPWLNDEGAEGLQWNYLADNWSQDAAGLPVSGLVHVQAEMNHELDPAIETEWISGLALAGDLPQTVCVGYADLRRDDLSEILARHERFETFRGVRQEAWFDPESRRSDVPRFNLLDDPAWVAGLRELSARDLVFDLLVGSSQLDQACQIFGTQPELRVVLEHLGVPSGTSSEALADWRRGLARFAKEVPQSVLKISALSFLSSSWDVKTLRPLVREAIEIFGPQRCMFASNFPVDKLAVSYSDLWSTYSELVVDLAVNEREALFSGTARRAYRIATGARSTEKGGGR